jgi:hypothetical protein
MYTEVNVGRGVDDFETELKWYTGTVLIEDIVLTISLLIVAVALIFKAYKFNKEELRLHGKVILAYSIFFAIAKLQHTSEYIYLFQTFN